MVKVIVSITAPNGWTGEQWYQLWQQMEAKGLTVADHVSSDPMTRAATALEANTAAVLELCGLVAASFEQGHEEAYDAPAVGQTMNSPRRK